MQRIRQVTSRPDEDDEIDYLEIPDVGDIKTPSHFIFRSLSIYSERQNDIIYNAYEAKGSTNASSAFHDRKTYYLSRVCYLRGWI